MMFLKLSVKSPVGEYLVRKYNGDDGGDADDNSLFCQPLPGRLIEVRL